MKEYEREHEAPSTTDNGECRGGHIGLDVLDVPELRRHNEVIQWPKHYNQGKIQMTDYVLDQNLDWCSGNVVKYVVRSPHKGQRLQDLEKAQWYLSKLIEEVKAGRDPRARSTQAK